VAVEQLIELIMAADVAGIDTLLRSLDRADRAEVKRWFDGSRSWFRELRNESRPGETISETRGAWGWAEGICAVSLLGAVTAARRVPWADFWLHNQWPSEAGFVQLLCDADRDWVAAFTDAASRVGLGRNARFTNDTLSRVLRTAVVHHELPCPSGTTFLREWLAGSPKGPLLDTLQRDPLMPELLYLYLASGECGRTPGLADATLALVDEGKVDRSHLIEIVLAQLTAQQRPASQRVFAELVRGLGVRAAEVPGGLSYLVGVIATSQGAVGQVLLPLAIDLLQDAADLTELASVIAGRPERKQKDVLLSALQSEQLRHRVGDPSTLEALRTLGADDDVAFAARVAKARAELGDAPAAEPTSGMSLGLWTQSPAAVSTERVLLHWWYSDLAGTWRKLLGQSPPGNNAVTSWAINATLNEIANGRFDFAILAGDAHVLLSAGKLSVPRTSRLLEDLFLGGAMRQAWPVALSLADEACAGARRPAGLEALLRMLSRYAREAPRQQLPAHVEALAAGTGESKAEQEARALGAALSREPLADYVTRIRMATDGPSLTIRGLWSRGGEARPLPMSQPIKVTTGVRLDELRLAAVDPSNEYIYLRDLVHDGAMTRSDLLLRDVLRAVVQHGADAVQGCLASVERLRPPGPVGAAVDLWARRTLTIPIFWKLALKARTYDDAWRQWRVEPGIGPHELQERLTPLQRLWEHVEDEVPILPSALNTRAARVTFLLACEALLRPGAEPVLLSTPTFEDSTLELDDLLDRLTARGDERVGPLDLMQALYRLRATDPARVNELDLPAVVTEPALTSPDGQLSWDAVEVVRTWVAAGGLPPLSSRPSSDGSRWIHEAAPPVSWELCAAAPQGMLDDDDLIIGGNTGALARVFALWPDRVLQTPFGDVLWDDVTFAGGLARLGGTFGLPSHDYLLGAVSRSDKGRRAESLGVLVELLGHDRLNPGLAAEAALGRLAAGTLALPTTVQSWEAIIECGGLRGLWPLALETAAALCQTTPKPSGLPALLRLLTAYAHEVPEPVVPDGVRILAESRGSTRTHVEARALVAAMTRGSQ
jgi:hypothetical protein